MAEEKRELTPEERELRRAAKRAQAEKMADLTVEELKRKADAGELVYNDEVGFRTTDQPAPQTGTPEPITVARRPGDANRQSEIQKRKELQLKYRNQEKVLISISPMYAPYVGTKMCLALNNCYTYIAADGNNYAVPVDFADLWQERRMHLDKQIKLALGMADTRNNLEYTPGEIDFM